jgi:hypothetical protein
MCSTHEGDIDVPNLPKAARTVHVVPDLASHSLLSIGQLCDAGCIVEFTATNATVRHNDSIVLQGHRTPVAQLWHVDLPNEAPIAELPSAAPIAESNAAVGSATPAELVSFAHASLWSPALSTLATALDNNYVTNFPGLTSRTFRNHPPHSAATIKGHLDQSRKNQRSTKTTFNLIEPDTAPEDLETFPSAPVDGARSHSCFVSTVEITGQICTDQTGKFITPSSTGNNCLLVLCNHDSNAILAAPMKSRHATAILNAHKSVHAQSCKAGLRPQLQRLDNECSEILKACMHALQNETTQIGIRSVFVWAAVCVSDTDRLCGLCHSRSVSKLLNGAAMCVFPCHTSYFTVE